MILCPIQPKGLHDMVMGVFNKIGGTAFLLVNDTASMHEDCLEPFIVVHSLPLIISWRKHQNCQIRNDSASEMLLVPNDMSHSTLV